MAMFSACVSLVLVALFTLFAGLLVQVGAVKTERDLRRDLFEDYDPTVRPVKRASTQVSVAVSASPLGITSMDEVEQVIVLDTWVMMKWNDEFLKWNPSEYDNITELRISPADIWKPDIALYTATPDTAMFPVVQTNAIAYNTGMVLWVPPFTMKSRCPLAPRTYFTNRSFVECNLRIASWTYSGPLMDIQLDSDEVDLSSFQDFNREWKLVKVVTKRESRHYACCDEEYPFVDFNVTLKRRNSFFTGTN